jgi:hypothetical protein
VPSLFVWSHEMRVQVPTSWSFSDFCWPTALPGSKTNPNAVIADECYVDSSLSSLVIAWRQAIVSSDPRHVPLAALGYIGSSLQQKGARECRVLALFCGPNCAEQCRLSGVDRPTHPDPTRLPLPDIHGSILCGNLFCELSDETGVPKSPFE